MKKKLLKLAVCLGACLVLAGLDQLTKQWAVSRLMGKPDIVLWEGVFRLHYLENTGMAFGLLKDQQTLFFIVTLAVVAFLVFALYKTPEKKRFIPMHIVLILVIAGAVGNFIDRTSQKYVVDFLYFDLINFPVFNVADVYVTAAGITALILMLFVYRDDELEGVYFKNRHGKDSGDIKTGEIPAGDIEDGKTDCGVIKAAAIKDGDNKAEESKAEENKREENKAEVLPAEKLKPEEYNTERTEITGSGSEAED